MSRLPQKIKKRKQQLFNFCLNDQPMGYFQTSRKMRKEPSITPLFRRKIFIVIGEVYYFNFVVVFLKEYSTTEGWKWNWFIDCSQHDLQVKALTRNITVLASSLSIMFISYVLEGQSLGKKDWWMISVLEGVDFPWGRVSLPLIDDVVHFPLLQNVLLCLQSSDSVTWDSLAEMRESGVFIGPQF